jgi:hypothetical protein
MGGYALFIFGLAAFILSMLAIRRAKASKSWPTTEGTITGTELESAYDDDGDLSGYTPRVYYDYTIDGRTYSSGTYGISTGKMNQARAEQVIAPFLAGQKVRVFYNPKNQHDAVINTDFNRTIYILLVISVVLGAGGLVWIIAG